MDPNANLKEQLALANSILHAWGTDQAVPREDIGHLAELVLALDEWIRKGGSFPTEWADSLAKRMRYTTP